MNPRTHNLFIRSIRWILTLPLAMIGAYLVNWFNHLIFTSDIVGEKPVTITVLVGLIAGFALVAIGVYIAPNHKKVTSIVLLAFLILTGILSLTLMLRSFTGIVLTHGIAQVISSVIGGLAMTILYCKGWIYKRF